MNEGPKSQDSKKGLFRRSDKKRCPSARQTARGSLNQRIRPELESGKIAGGEGVGRSPWLDMLGFGDNSGTSRDKIWKFIPDLIPDTRHP